MPSAPSTNYFPLHPDSKIVTSLGDLKDKKLLCTKAIQSQLLRLGVCFRVSLLSVQADLELSAILLPEPAKC